VGVLLQEDRNSGEILARLASTGERGQKEKVDTVRRPMFRETLKSQGESSGSPDVPMFSEKRELRNGGRYCKKVVVLKDWGGQGKVGHGRGEVIQKRFEKGAEGEK